LIDIENFCARVFQAKINNEKVCIYSDYDTDAITATGVMHQGLLDLGFLPENLSTYAPDRFTEGYGINPEAMTELVKPNDLIISVDCGINSVEEADIVKASQKCDLIITDHHHLHDQIPDCIAVINPRLADYYTQNPFQKSFYNPNLNNSELENAIKNWQQKVYSSNSQNFLSKSVTGVGVAWFSLVWYAYFCQEIFTN
jgi:single-stranded-DNA-specific exonuclease